jgi:ABC-type dipeptide/oligopeptide/nickel transport system permease component
MGRAKQKKETDSQYFLKLILYLVLGSTWLRISIGGQGTIWPIPIGALLGIIFARHDSFQIDRKIEYATIVLSMFVGFWLPIGLILEI